MAEARDAAQALPQCALEAAQRHRDAAATALGFLVLLGAARCATAAARFVWAHWGRRGADPCGPWAVVTGASEGIGRSFARLLAQKGVNIVLIALPEPRLHECAAELQAECGVRTRVVPLDLTSAEPQLTATLGAALDGIEVGTLINNAGLFQPFPDYLEEMPEQRIRNMVTVNALVPTLLCKMVLPGMKARRRGNIVNIGSATASAMSEAPLLSVYAASKAYLESLSRSVDAEAAPLGVRCQCLWPMFVATRMPGISTASLMAPSPDAWAAAAMRQLNHEASFTPFWFHGLVAAALKLAPGTARKQKLKVTLASREKGLQGQGRCRRACHSTDGC